MESVTGDAQLFDDYFNRFKKMQ